MTTVRFFESCDAQPLADLMLEMASFYGATVDPKLAVAEDIIRQAKTTDIIIAHHETNLLGFAIFGSGSV